MLDVLRSGQAELTGTDTGRPTLPTPDSCCAQLEMFNPKTLIRRVRCDPGDSKATTGGKRTRFATGSGGAP